ncbi:MAG: hypothetical protein K0S08_944 [Gammaproteobacteria bacterium]|jgi:hypothetical protein|nr:hypothetical protein [Gammaproteobacteria bacterium]
MAIIFYIRQYLELLTNSILQLRELALFYKDCSPTWPAVCVK